jgi:uncharacterized cupredoxin-like copper-binding protein
VVGQRTLGIVLVTVGVAGLVATSWAFSTITGAGGWGISGWGPFTVVRGRSACTIPSLPGQSVDVILSDMSGGMMAGGLMGGTRHMMNVAVGPSTVASGDVSFRVRNEGMMVHELVILPLPPDGAGTRPVNPDGRVGEKGNVGEASTSCGEGPGDGIAPGAAGWVTVHLATGRYELICNEPGHYAMGMFTSLRVEAQSQ